MNLKMADVEAEVAKMLGKKDLLSLLVTLELEIERVERRKE